MHRAQLDEEERKALDGSECGIKRYERYHRDEYVLSNRDIFQIFRRHFLMIMVISMSFTVMAVGYSFSQTPVYEARSTILVGQASGIGQSPTEAASLQSVTPTMAEAIMSHRVAEAVVEELDLEASPGELLENVTAQQLSESQFLELYYTDTDPDRAQQVANAFGEEFSQQVSALETDAAVDAGVPPLSATVWDSAVVTPEPVSPAPLRNGLVALAVGLVVGSGLALLIELLRGTRTAPYSTYEKGDKK